MALFTCRDIALGYNGKSVLSGITFTVNEGEYLCVLGENGTGKSTLIKSLLHLIPPVTGEILMDDNLSANEIGYLPQQSVMQRDFPALVSEVVLSGCLNRIGLRPYYSKAEKKLAANNMKRLDITQLAKRCYRELSGGQQQRVLLARALCATRKLLLLDEPVAGLDPKAAIEMYQIIESLNKNDGITVIMISHDVAASIKYASHIMHLGNSSSLFFGMKEDYVQSDISKAFGIMRGGDML